MKCKVKDKEGQGAKKTKARQELSWLMSSQLKWESPWLWSEVKSMNSIQVEWSHVNYLMAHEGSIKSLWSQCKWPLKVKSSQLKWSQVKLKWSQVEMKLKFKFGLKCKLQLKSKFRSRFRFKSVQVQVQEAKERSRHDTGKQKDPSKGKPQQVKHKSQNIVKPQQA